MKTRKNSAPDEAQKRRAIFVYIRRSTRNKQELSLERQDDSARETITEAGFNPDEVQYYIESMTAYNGVRVENGTVKRKRVEFTRMLKDIDASPVPVVLLAYEDSRLSRNDPDTNAILDRLFGEYEPEKQNIEKIVFNGGYEWTRTTNKGDVKQRLLDRYKESLKTGERSGKAMLRELRKGRYLLSTPKGINRLKKGEQALSTNEDIVYIKKAWEMRAKGVSKREIQQYLKRCGVIITDSFEHYFQTLIYTGYWRDTETGELVRQNFQGDPPISLDLWQQVQSTLLKNTGKRAISKYGTRQEGDIIARLLKWEEDSVKRFSVEFPKQKAGKGYKSYKSNAFGGFNKSERKIVSAFLGRIQDLMLQIVGAVVKKQNEHTEKTLREFAQKETKWEDTALYIIMKAKHNREFSREEAEWAFREYCKTKEWEEACDRIITEGNAELMRQLSVIVASSVQEGGNLESIKTFRKERETEKGKIEKEMEQKGSEIREERATLVHLLANGKITQEDFEIAKDRMNGELSRYAGKIQELSDSSDFERFLGRLPEVLLEIFELSCDVLRNEDFEAVREDIYKLVEITTFELSVNDKKELKVKLFEGLEGVLNTKKGVWLPELDSNQ